jgi:hypothetical protein
LVAPIDPSTTLSSSTVVEAIPGVRMAFQAEAPERRCPRLNAAASELRSRRVPGLPAGGGGKVSLGELTVGSIAFEQV